MDDEVHIASKVLSLWDIPLPEEVTNEGGSHSAMLGTFGGITSLENFLAGFVALPLGDGETFDFHQVKPLYKYIYTLNTPENPNPALR